MLYLNSILRLLYLNNYIFHKSGGVGWYTFNLVTEIKKSDCEVLVLCDQKWNEDYKCVSPFTEDNSNIILKAVEDVKPDVIHIQFEPGLYG